ncbi:ABC transporter permease [Clostridium sp. D2Q-14]|uniref:ABC transporter permease n=1 Tax=Anaeromonas gelatinilytica TaxID=2683194 RepID=UPI00193BF150|nr:ABC transporter permease [Anaeromonas gelatinilytica]MBS4535462.1 ABC transporter permease [Anaeromonas gelatinilytica]
MVEKSIKKFYIFLVFLFLYAPILVLIIFSFNNSRLQGSWEGFTLNWYRELFKSREIMKSLYYTLSIATLSSIIVTIIGTLSAIGIYNMKSFRKKIILNINYLPVLNPDIVTGISLMTLFIFLKIRLGYTTMLLSHITFNIPYVILAVLPKLKQMPKDMPEAAMDLGATPFYAFRKVILPEISSGIVTGALIAFTLSIDDFVISFFTTGSGVSNLSITIYSMARRGIDPKINALSTLMFVSVLILMIIINKRSSNKLKREGV